MKKKILFNRDSSCLQPLRFLIMDQNHRALVLWALEYAGGLVDVFEERYPAEPRPRQTVELCRTWARGEIKMPAAKQAILETHRIAAELSGDYPYSCILHAVGQAVSTIHAETHAIGGPIYALTGLAHLAGEEGADAAVENECDRLCSRLLYWQTAEPAIDRSWADFLRRDQANQEKRLYEKSQLKSMQK